MDLPNLDGHLDLSKILYTAYIGACAINYKATISAQVHVYAQITDAHEKCGALIHSKSCIALALHLLMQHAAQMRIYEQ